MQVKHWQPLWKAVMGKHFLLLSGVHVSCQPKSHWVSSPECAMIWLTWRLTFLSPNHTMKWTNCRMESAKCIHVHACVTHHSTHQWSDVSQSSRNFYFLLSKSSVLILKFSSWPAGTSCRTSAICLIRWGTWCDSSWRSTHLQPQAQPGEMCSGCTVEWLIKLFLF